MHTCNFLTKLFIKSLIKHYTHLSRHSSPEEDRQCQSWVDLLHQLSQLLWTFELVLFQPFLHQLLLSLSKDGTAELQSFVLVQLAALEQDAKVLEEWGGLTWLCRNLLEPQDSLRCTKNALLCKEKTTEILYLVQRIRVLHNVHVHTRISTCMHRL